MTTKDIIKILPIGKDLQLDLLAKYDTLDQDSKASLINIVWEAYEVFYKMRVQEKLGEVFTKSENWAEEVDPELYSRIKADVDKEMSVEYYDKAANTDLAGVRAKIEAIINQQTQK